MVGDPFEVDADYYLTLLARERQIWDRKPLTEKERATFRKRFGTGTARVWWRKVEKGAPSPRYVLAPVVNIS